MSRGAPRFSVIVCSKVEWKDTHKLHIDYKNIKENVTHTRDHALHQ